MALERGELARDDDRRAVAEREARAAHRLYRDHGWTARARMLASRLGLETVSESARRDPRVSVSIDLQRHLGALLRVSLASATVVDPEEQARVALDEIITLLGAERAYLLFCKPGTDLLELQVGRSAEGDDIEQLEGYSRTVVEKVRSTREPLVVNGAAEGAGLGSDSAVTHGLRSILAAPLLLHERLVGVVYLDTRLAEGIFTEAEVEILLAIGSHIAVALETVRTAQVGTYERVAANVPGMVFQLSRTSDGWLSFLFASEGCRGLFGVDPEEATVDASALLDRIHPEDRQDLAKSLEISARTLAPWRWEGRSTGTGVDLWLQGEARPQRQAHGAVVWDGLIMDISTRKTAEDALERQAKDLVRSNADLEQFAYAASHDLQEPLRVVASYLQLLSNKYKGKLDKDADEFIGFAVDGSVRMQRMIADLLEYSRVGTRGKRFERAELDEALEMAKANLRTAIDESEAQIASEPLPVLPADRTQLVQLFQNLIGNAIKFRGEAPVLVRIDSKLDGTTWRISVSDNGIGIKKSQHQRVFGIFQRLHTRKEYPGTGVGLAICKKIVERHSGRIWVESEAGAGTTFHFTLPSIQPDSAEWKIPTVVDAEY